MDNKWYKFNDENVSAIRSFSDIKVGVTLPLLTVPKLTPMELRILSL